MSAPLRFAMFIPLLLSTLSIQTSQADSQLSGRPISSKIYSAPTALQEKSFLSAYPIRNEYDGKGRHHNSAGSTELHPDLQQSNPIGQEISHSKPDVLKKEDDKRAFKFGKRAESDVDIDTRNKKAFKFGKRSDSEEDDAIKRAFKFGKRYDSEEDDDAIKRAFKFGKKSNLEPVDYESYVKQNGFKFGKRLSANNFDNSDDLTTKRAFKFGKRFDAHDDDDDDDVSKRAQFKFGKRADSGYFNQEAILGDAPTRGWNDVRSASPSMYRSGAARDSVEGMSPEGLDGDTSELGGFKYQQDKRAFKFGKKSFGDWQQQLLLQQQLRQQQQREMLRQRARDQENEGVQRRLFKLGRRSEGRNEQLKSGEREEEERKRQFKFGK